MVTINRANQRKYAEACQIPASIGCLSTGPVDLTEPMFSCHVPDAPF